ncbi:MAG: TlpA family protein disulfide reductase [Prevotella sp.]
MKTIRRAFFLLAISSCMAAEAGVVMSGKISNETDKVITMYCWKDGNRHSDTLLVDKKGKYSYSFQQGVTDYFLKVGDWVMPIYGTDNDKLSADIVVDKKKVDVKFRGSHAAENNYLCMLAKLQNFSMTINTSQYISFKAYAEEVDKLCLQTRSMLGDVKEKSIFETTTPILEKAPNYIKLDFARIYKDNSAKLSADADFKTYIDTLNLSDSQHVDFNIAYQVLNERLPLKKDTTDFQRDVEIMYALKKFVGESLINEYSTKLIRWRMGGGRQKEMEQLFKAYTDVCNDKNIIESIKADYKTYMAAIAVCNGSEAPDCKIYDTEGNVTSLSDMRGKMLFIDVWATWCGPCKREIPHFAKLYDLFKDSKDIEFISISVDTNKKAWKNMVEKDKHEWKQYIETTEADSDFSQKFGIEMIPRFIIIDKNGIVRDINFLRPSNPKSEETLKKMIASFS